MKIRKPLLNINKMQIWLVATCIMLSVSFNVDWKANGLLWWGSIFLFLTTYIFYKNFKLNLSTTFSDIWMMIFLFLSILSVTYSTSMSTTFSSVKTLIIMFLICFIIGKEIEYKEDLKKFLWLIFIALLIVVIYVYINVDLNSLILTRIGEANTGRWNANDIGIMTSVGILIGIALFSNVEKTSKVVIIIAIFLFIYLDIIAASRKAFLMLIIGICGMRILNNPTKVIRNILFVFIIVLLILYLVFKIPFLYDLIGWRIAGIMAFLNGENSIADSSSIYRAKMLYSAINTFISNPLLGVGLDNFRYYNPVRVTYAHNNFVEIAADLGIIGFIGYYWIYVYILFNYIKNFKNKDTMKTFLFVIIMSYLLNHFAMITILDILQSLFICFYATYAKLDE